MLLLVVDLKNFYHHILNKGISNFLEEHLKQKFSVFSKFFKKTELDVVKWLSGKEIIVALNKKDLIEHDQMIELENRINLEKSELKVSLNRISCLDEQESDISELLDQLREKLSQLFVLFCFFFHL